MTNQEEESHAIIHILVVDDQQLVRDGIASLLRIQDGMSVVATAMNGQEALDLAIKLHPDVILMDVRMPVMDGVEATREILRQVPSCRILMLTTFDDDEYVRDALRAGARGYLLKDIAALDLANAVIAASKGVYQFDEAVMERMIDAFSKSAKKSEAEEGRAPAHLLDPTGLTYREIEVLRLVATGASNREVAESLVISEGTVKNHLSNIFSRLGLRDRTQAVLYAREHGLL